MMYECNRPAASACVQYKGWKKGNQKVELIFSFQRIEATESGAHEMDCLTLLRQNFVKWVQCCSSREREKCIFPPQKGLCKGQHARNEQCWSRGVIGRTHVSLSPTFHILCESVSESIRLTSYAKLSWAACHMTYPVPVNISEFNLDSVFYC